MTKIRINGSELGIEVQKVKVALQELAAKLDDAPNNLTLDIVSHHRPEWNLRRPEHGLLAPGVDPDSIPPHILPYVSGIDFDDRFGYLAPDTDPDTVPPHILPYVQFISRRNIEITDLRDQISSLKLERDSLRKLSLDILSGDVDLKIS